MDDKEQLQPMSFKERWLAEKKKGLEVGRSSNPLVEFLVAENRKKNEEWEKRQDEGQKNKTKANTEAGT